MQKALSEQEKADTLYRVMSTLEHFTKELEKTLPQSAQPRMRRLRAFLQKYVSSLHISPLVQKAILLPRTDAQLFSCARKFPGGLDTTIIALRTEMNRMYRERSALEQMTSSEHPSRTHHTLATAYLLETLADVQAGAVQTQAIRRDRTTWQTLANLYGLWRVRYS